MRIKTIQVVRLLVVIWICEGICAATEEEDAQASKDTDLASEGLGSDGSVSGRVSVRPSRTGGNTKSQLNRKFARGINLIKRIGSTIATTFVTDNNTVTADNTSTTTPAPGQDPENLTTAPGITISVIRTEMRATMDLSSLVASGGSKLFEILAAAFTKGQN